MQRFHNIRQFNNNTPQLAAGCYIDAKATVIGDVKLGEDSSVWPNAVIRGDLEPIIIGARTNVQDNAVLHTSQPSNLSVACPLTIGDEVIIGHSAVLHGCTIANNVLIGIGVIVLDRVEIESNTIIAAGCMVPPGKKLKSGWVYAGNPCKPLREIKPKELEFLTWSPNSYVKLKNKYLES